MAISHIHVLVHYHDNTWTSSKDNLSFLNSSCDSFWYPHPTPRTPPTGFPSLVCPSCSGMTLSRQGEFHKDNTLSSLYCSSIHSSTCTLVGKRVSTSMMSKHCFPDRAYQGYIHLPAPSRQVTGVVPKETCLLPQPTHNWLLWLRSPPRALLSAFIISLLPEPLLCATIASILTIFLHPFFLPLLLLLQLENTWEGMYQSKDLLWVYQVWLAAAFRKEVWG